MRISYSELRLSAPLGSGAQGTIYRVQQGETFGFAFPLIYKEFKASTVVAGASLETLANLRNRLDTRDRQIIDERTVWPVAVVDRGGRVSGYLMQAIPDKYMQTIIATTGAEPIPREVQHLFVADDLARKNLGEAPNNIERMVLARETAFALGFLHKRQLIFGDFSYKNAVYAIRPAPMVMLLDCDAVRLRGQGAAVAQLNSPGWGAPERGPQTIESDRYKLGLFILRCLTPGVNAQSRDPAKASGVFDRAGMTLLERALSDDPDDRTSGKEWVQYLDGKIASAGGLQARRGHAAKPAAPPKMAKVSSRSLTPGPARRPVSTAPGPGPRSVITVRAPIARGTWNQPTGLRPAQVHTVRTLLGPATSPGPRVSMVQAFLLIAWLAAVLIFVVAAVSSSVNSDRAATRPTTPRGGGTTTPAVPSLGNIAATMPKDPELVATTTAEVVDRAQAALGEGWRPTAVSEAFTRSALSAGSSPTTPANVSSSPVVWTVEFVDEPLMNDQGRWIQNLRAVTVEGASVEVGAPIQLSMAPGTVVPQLVDGWPLTLQRGLELVANPLRLKEPVLVAFGWNRSAIDGDTNPAWQFTYFSTTAPLKEVDRVFVVPDGSRTTRAPSWSSG
jgi:hypothetical protein